MVKVNLTTVGPTSMKLTELIDALKDEDNRYFTNVYHTIFLKDKIVQARVKPIELINDFENERNRFLTIAYNAICLGQLDEQFSKNELIRELGCTEEEYDEIMG